MLWRLRVQFVGTLQFAFVFEAFGFHSLFTLNGVEVDLLGFGCLTLCVCGSCVRFGLGQFGIGSLPLDIGLTGADLMFGFSCLLTKLCCFFSLMFPLLCGSFTADGNDDSHDDQDDDDGDDDPDDG